MALRHGVGEGRRIGWSPSLEVEWSDDLKRQIVAEIHEEPAERFALL